jgi:gamma-butyrobetaine dioxygenase
MAARQLTGKKKGSPERPERSEGAGLPSGDAADALLGIPAIWLRANCGCAECRDPRSGERLTSISDLPAGVAVTAVQRTGNRIEIEFGPDRHRTVYDARWLDQFRPAAAMGGEPQQPGRDAARRDGLTDAEDARGEAAKQLWDASGITGAFPQGSWPLYQASTAHRQACLRAVLRAGFVVLADMPREPDAVLAVADSTGIVGDPGRGQVIDVRVGASPPSRAFTSRPMAACTGAAFLDPLPTVKILGCLDDAAAGGESTLVDGFFAAARLRAENAAAFAVLTATPVTFTRISDHAQLQATRPIISADPRGRIREIRFASSYLSPLRGPASQIIAFYDAYRSFARLLADPDLTVAFRLQPGDCLILDNTRILNGRAGFTDTGRRHLQACWADLDAIASQLATLELPEHNGRTQH